MILRRGMQEATTSLLSQAVPDHLTQRRHAACGSRLDAYHLAMFRHHSLDQIHQAFIVERLDDVLVSTSFASQFAVFLSGT